MVLKNTSKKIINIGLLTLLPGEVKPLTGKAVAEYANNPVVDFFIKKGNLQVVDGEYIPDDTNQELATQEQAERLFLLDRCAALGQPMTDNSSLDELRIALNKAEEEIIATRVGDEIKKENERKKKAGIKDSSAVPNGLDGTATSNK